MAFNPSQSSDPSSFGLLRSSFSKFRSRNHDHLVHAPPGQDTSPRFRRSSLDSSRPQYDAAGRGDSHRRASLQFAPANPASVTRHQISSLVQEISDPSHPVRLSNVRKEHRPLPASTLPPPVIPPPSDAHKPDPKLIINALSQMSHIGSMETQSRLDVHEQMIIHQLDQIDAEERNLLRLKSTGHSSSSLSPSSSLSKPSSLSSLELLHPPNVSERDALTAKHLSALRVFGTALRKSNIYASTSVLLGGRQLELPIIVVSCVEELYRTGLYQPALFRTLPNPNRLRELVEVFNREDVPADIIVTPRPKAAKRGLGTSFGEHVSLHLEATADICSLLSTYLMSLPEPVFILGHGLFDAMWEWCGVGQCNDDDYGLEYAAGSGGVPHVGQHLHVHSSPSSKRTGVTEKERIRAAQLVLHLLPSANFDLLVYLLAFFSQVVLVEKENGLGVSGLAAMFGENLFGNGTGEGNGYGKGSQVPADDPSGRGRVMGQRDGEGKGVRMMSWLLRRWGRLSHQLFDVPSLVLTNRPSPPSPETARSPLGKTSTGSPFSSIASNLQGECSTHLGQRYKVARDECVTARAGVLSDASSAYTYSKDADTGDGDDTGKVKKEALIAQTLSTLTGEGHKEDKQREGRGERRFSSKGRSGGERSTMLPEKSPMDTYSNDPEAGYGGGEGLGKDSEFQDTVNEHHRSGTDRGVDDLLDDMIKSYEFVDAMSPTRMARPVLDDRSISKSDIKHAPASPDIRPAAVILPLHVKGKQAYVEVGGVYERGHGAPGSRALPRPVGSTENVMVPVVTLQNSDMSRESSASDLRARLMDVTLSDLEYDGLDPLGDLFSRDAQRRRTDSRIPSPKTTRPVRRPPMGDMEVQRLTPAERGGVDGYQDSKKLRSTSVHRLEEQLQMVKEQNAQALGALEKATKQISSLEAQLKDMDS